VLSAFSALVSHRVRVTYDGVEILGASVDKLRPENSQQMAELLRELLASVEAPVVPDPDFC